jgi:hypothetical protein
MRSLRKIKGDFIARCIKWHTFVKPGTLIKFVDSDGVTRVGQVVEVDKKCDRGMHLRVRKFKEAIYQASYIENVKVVGIHTSPKRGCWIPVKEIQSNKRKRIRSIPHAKYARHKA